MSTDARDLAAPRPRSTSSSQDLENETISRPERMTASGAWSTVVTSRALHKLERDARQDEKTKNQAQIEQAWAIKTGDQTLQLLHDFTLNNALSQIVRSFNQSGADLRR